MPIFNAHTKLDNRAAADALSDALETLYPEPTGIDVMDTDDGTGIWVVDAYFVEEPDLAGLALLATLHGAADFAVQEMPDVDWVAKVKRDLAPVVAGRFFVYGSHDADNVPEDCEPLLVEAALAFGSGHHGTTLGCLRALDGLANDGFVGQNVADIGCGTAVLAMGAARIWPNTVLASDIDPVAVEVAQQNVVDNGLDGRVHCVTAAGFDHPDLAKAAPFDLVFANILKGPLIDLAPDVATNLAPNGHMILSGILNEQADAIVSVYARFGINLTQREDIGEWTTLMLQNKP